MVLPIRLKLSHKLLALVIIPLIVSLTCFVKVTELFLMTEKVAIREAHAKNVVVKCNGIHDYFFDAATALAGFTVSRNEDFGNKYFENINNVMHDLRTIEVLISDYPNHHESFHRLQEACAEGIDMLEQYRNATTKSGRVNTSFRVSEMRGSIQLTLDRILGSTEDLMREERAISDIAPMTQSNLHGQILYFLVGGIALTVVFAVSFAIVLLRGIVNRIDVVVRNTKRIVTHEKLLPRVGGTDEISIMDGVFHDMADEIERVAKHKQELVSMVSHDLRSPLMSVQVSLELIASGAIGELQARMSKEVSAASRNVKRLIELINDLLDIEKMEAGRLDMHITRQSLLPLIESAVDSVAGMASKKGIFIQQPMFDIVADCDHQRLVQVLVNLLSNSIKFSPENGEIGIEIEDSEKEVKIKVRDDGPGIEKEAIDKIFDRFSQGENKQDANETNRAKKGTGLGLAICKAIVAGHDGQIGVDSEVGKGSTFWFTLPRRSDI